MEDHKTSELLTEQEAAVYDRQIRVWGVDAQRRLSKVRVLVVGMSNVIAEICKNIVLAGIGSLTLMDDSFVGWDVESANFLIPVENLTNGRHSIATSCKESLEDFNPMVHVSVEEGSLTQKPPEYLDDFDAVVIGRSSLSYRKHINALCRKRPHRVGFFTVDCRGSIGEIFVDLQTHSYTLKTKENEPQVLHFCTLEEALAVPWHSLRKRTTKLFFAMRLLEEFEQANERTPGQVSSDDLTAALDLRKRLCELQGVPESWISEKLLDKLLDAGTRELPPVCAIMGGILGQELLKAMSGKGEPLKNFFYFDPSEGKGIIEDISNEIRPNLTNHVSELLA